MENKDETLKELEKVRKDLEYMQKDNATEYMIAQKEYEAKAKNINEMDRVVRDRMEAIKRSIK